MDAIDLLAREDEFKRLNKQLEKKTESLMKEIEHAMQKQDIFSEFSPSLTMQTKQNYKKHCCTPPSQPDTPIKRYIKKKPLKLESPKSLDSEESEYENQNINNREFHKNQCLNKGRSSDYESQRLNKSKTEFGFESQLSNKNSKESELESHFINKNKIYRSSESQSRNKNRRGSQYESQTFKNNGRNNTHNAVVCDCCPHSQTNRNEDLEFLYAFVNLNVKDKVLPASFSKEDRVTVESVCKFLSSKIKLMQEQIDKLQNAIEKKASQCESHLRQLAELESERMTLLNRTNNMKSSSADIRAKYMAMQKRLDEKDKQYKEQRSETDKQSSELKRLRTKNANVEAKCASQEQVIETLKQQLEVCKRSEKEFRDSTRQLSSTYENTISRLENSLASLTARAEKQSALVLNLRKQNALLAAGGALEALNVDYAGFLNQEF